jgi:hypothetical protein
LKEEQKIIKLEEMIDNEIIARHKLEQEARLLMLRIEKTKNLKEVAGKKRSSSMFADYEGEEYKKKAYVRNTITSTVFKD